MLVARSAYVVAVVLAGCGEAPSTTTTSRAIAESPDGGVGVEVPSIPEPPPAWEGTGKGAAWVTTAAYEAPKTPAERLVARFAARSDEPLLVKAVVVDLDTTQEAPIRTLELVRIRVETHATLEVVDELCGRAVDETLELSFYGGVVDGVPLHTTSYPSLDVGGE